MNFFPASFVFLLAALLSPALQAQTFTLGHYSQGAYNGVQILKVSKDSIEFSANSANPYRGSNCGIEGLAKTVSPNLWLFKKLENEGCTISFSVRDPKTIELKTDAKCSTACGMGAVAPTGIFVMTSESCADDQAKIEGLSRPTTYALALGLARKVERECLAGLDDNASGSLYSDIALLSFKLGSRKECLEAVEKGFAALKAKSGLKELESSFEFYAGSKENLNCDGVWNGGCLLFRERIHIFKQLEKHRKICEGQE